jgi:hypothetical protein
MSAGVLALKHLKIKLNRPFDRPPLDLVINFSDDYKQSGGVLDSTVWTRHGLHAEDGLEPRKSALPKINCQRRIGSRGLIDPRRLPLDAD